MISVTIEGGEVLTGIELQLLRLEKIPMPLWEDIGTLLLDSVKENFLKSGRPSQWKPSKRVEKYGGSTMILTGDLMYSGFISEKLDNSITLTFGQGKVYANILQYGGWAGRGHKSYIPPRPYALIQQEDETKITEMFQSYIDTGSW